MDTVLEKKIEDAVTLAYDTGVFAGRNGNGSLKKPRRLAKKLWE